MGQSDRSQKKWLFTLIRIALVACGVGLAILLLGKGFWKFAQRLGANRMAANQIGKLETARANWEARPFTRYRLIIEPGSDFCLGCCGEDVEIENEVVTTVFEAHCGATRTITDLFNDIETTITRRECGPNGCACDGIVSVEAVYHAQLGYPLRIRTYFEKDWSTAPDPFEMILGCTFMGISLPEIKVTLTPLE